MLLLVLINKLQDIKASYYQNKDIRTNIKSINMEKSIYEGESSESEEESSESEEESSESEEEEEEKEEKEESEEEKEEKVYEELFEEKSIKKNIICKKCKEEYYSASGTTVLCPECRESEKIESITNPIANPNPIPQVKKVAPSLSELQEDSGKFQKQEEGIEIKEQSFDSGGEEDDGLNITCLTCQQSYSSVSGTTNICPDCRGNESHEECTKCKTKFNTGSDKNICYKCK